MKAALIVLVLVVLVGGQLLLPPSVPAAAPPTPVPLWVTPTPVSLAKHETLTHTQLTAAYDTYLSDLTRNRLFSGVILVARGNKILYQNAFGYFDKEDNLRNELATKFRIASLSKQFTAAGILNLQAQHKLDVQDHVCAYLPSCPDEWQPITLHQLLTHTSGVSDITRFRNYDEYFALAHTRAELLKHAQDAPLDFKPGTRFSYSNPGYFLLALVIERVSGQSYEAFLREQFFVPFGMRSTGSYISPKLLATGYPNGYVSHRNLTLDFDNSNFLGSAGLYSTVSDLYRWSQALKAWRTDVKSNYHAMFTPYVTADPEPWSYGYGLRIGNAQTDSVVWHTGHLPGFSTFFVTYTDTDLTEIILSNNGDANLFFMEPNLARLALSVP